MVRGFITSSVCVLSLKNNLTDLKVFFIYDNLKTAFLKCLSLKKPVDEHFINVIYHASFDC